MFACSNKQTCKHQQSLHNVQIMTLCFAKHRQNTQRQQTYKEADFV